MTRASLMNPLCAALAALTLGACMAEEDPATRSEARLSGGRSDAGEDLCRINGWYGDGVCDDFCPEADADCDVCPALVESHSCFSTDAWTCPEGSSAVVEPDGCGCGCVADAGRECPTSADPAVTYHSCFTTDAWSCPAGSAEVIDPDGCGCYCEAKGETCPSPEEVLYHSCFTTDAFACPSGTRFVDDAGACGCYCVAE